MLVIKAVGLELFVAKLIDSEGEPFYTLTDEFEDAMKFNNDEDAATFLYGIETIFPGSFDILPVDEQIDLW